MIAIYIPLNIFVIVRPAITSSGMLESLSCIFILGFMLPYSERYIKKIIANF